MPPPLNPPPPKPEPAATEASEAPDLALSSEPRTSRRKMRPEAFRPARTGGAPKSYRLRFEKTGAGALLGHLALARELPRAIRRAGLTVARYNEILREAQRDPSLAGRIQALVDKAAAGK